MNTWNNHNYRPYIPSILESIINLCNDNNFLLLTMPWEMHIVDIAQDCCNSIIRAQQNRSNICASFFNAVFSPEQNDSFKNYPQIKHIGISSPIVSIENLHKAFTEASNAKYSRIKNLLLNILRWE